MTPLNELVARIPGAVLEYKNSCIFVSADLDPLELEADGVKELPADSLAEATPQNIALARRTGVAVGDVAGHLRAQIGAETTTEPPFVGRFAWLEIGLTFEGKEGSPTTAEDFEKTWYWESVHMDEDLGSIVESCFLRQYRRFDLDAFYLMAAKELKRRQEE